MPWPTERTQAVATAAALAAALLVAGCMTPPPGEAPSATPPSQTQPPPSAPSPASVLPEPAPAPPPPPARDAADVAARQLLAYHDRLRTMGAAELAREHLRLADAAGAPQTLELALLLAQRRANGDLARALALLEPLLRDDAAANPWAAPARLLHARLAEQRRLEDQLERQGQQLREQQRRIDQLASQLDALRAIERSLTARPPTPPAVAVPAAPAASAPRTTP
ncbi:MAG: hypothetical protein KF683_05710 [Rubrivivax sp.]|nr:hypothetical protein [Rubrivivax sp.]